MKVFLVLITLCATAFWSALAFPGAAPQIVQRDDNLFPVSIIHINDFHARFEETNERSTSCKQGEKCIGGLARTVHMVKSLLVTRRLTNPLYLNAGDSFQGTLWYNFGRWNVTSQFLNMLKADAMTLGNHEFDDYVHDVVKFLDAIKSPMVVSNIDDTEEPTMQGKYNKSIIIDKYDRKIGIIGVVLSTFNEIANTGKLKFLNESKAVRDEAEVLKQQGVDIIIVLSHCGLDVDYKIAQYGGPHIDVIVGGHTHTFMFTGDKPPGPDKPADKYPAVVNHPDGHKVLIVQASSFVKYVGDLTVYFDRQGKVASWEGAPIFLENDVPQDEETRKAIIPWKTIIDTEASRPIGRTMFPLLKEDCGTGECNLGNFVTDAFIYHYATQIPHERNEWTSAAIAMIQFGGIRTTLDKGAISFGDLMTTLPFEATVDAYDIRGDHLKEALEYAVSKSSYPDRFFSWNLLQVSGLKVVYNVSQPVNNRVVSVLALCQKCMEPRYEPLDLTKQYRVITPDYIATGGDAFNMLANNKKNYRVGPRDVDLVAEYLSRVRVVATGKNGRITML